jgi:peptidoglycan/LPS O-acetylase OafA/YrhL
MTIGGAVSESTASPSRANSDGVAVLPLALILVLTCTVAYLAMHETDMHTWRRVGDIDAAACLLLIGGLVFPVATILACRMEGLRKPRRTDHFRQCSLLYAVVVLGTLTLATASEGRGSLGYAIGAIAVAAALLGVLANAVTLTAQVRRARAI